MKRILLFIALLPAIALTNLHAEETIVFRAILEMGNATSFSLSDASGKNSRWVKPGDVFMDWELTQYDPKTKALTLTKGDQKQVLSLSGDTAGTATTGPAYAEAEAVFEAMQFDEMLDAIIDQQKQATLDMMRQMMEREAGGQPIDEELLGIQQQTIVDVYDAVDWDATKRDIINIYAETFSRDELNGMATFYSTPAGQAMIEKQPEIQKRTMETMMPRIMEIMPQVQEKTQQRMQEYYQKKQAAETETTE